MAKEKGSGKLIDAPVEKELDAKVVRGQLEDKVDYHNKLVAEKERLLGELQKVESALSENMGGIKTLQSFQNDFFVQDVPTVNGEV